MLFYFNVQELNEGIFTLRKPILKISRNIPLLSSLNSVKDKLSAMKTVFSVPDFHN
jgi:hypothetical protein